MDLVTFEDFKKLDIRIGKIISAEKVEGSGKLLKLEVDFGLPSQVLPEGKISEGKENAVEAPRPEIRQIVAGIAQFYAPEALIGKECPFAYNLAPRTLKGLESQGMILCPSDGNNSTSAEGSGVARPVLLHPDKEIPPGSVVK